MKENKIKKGFFRVATQNEIDYYDNFLYPFQDEIFEFIHNENFYLSGGTCLSRFYYNHRYSDDLDFFYDGLHGTISDFNYQLTEIFNKINEHYKIEITLSDTYFKRAFVYKNDKPLKLEFIFENYKNIGIRKQIKNTFIDTKENIATNKITAVYDRKTVKDFYDLYFLLQEINLENCLEWANIKIIPLDYEGVLIAFAEMNLQGEVLLTNKIKPLETDEFNNFVKKFIQQLIDYAKKTS